MKITIKDFKKTKENNARVLALKKISKMRWNGNTTHEKLENCLALLNFSGLYKPNVIKISGLTGYYMINEDGSIFCEAKIIKKEEKIFIIKYLDAQGWNQFKSFYIDYLTFLLSVE